MKKSHIVIETLKGKWVIVRNHPLNRLLGLVVFEGAYEDCVSFIYHNDQNLKN